MVTIALDFRSFAYYHPDYRRWITEDGDFDILIGASSADIRITEKVTLRSSQALPSILNRDSSLREWLADPRGKTVTEPILVNLRSLMADQFGISESDNQALGMDMMNFMLDMPLLNLFEFNENRLSVPADELFDSLLAQVYGDQTRQAIFG
jgi:beta-glucosidase